MVATVSLMDQVKNNSNHEGKDSHATHQGATCSPLHPRKGRIPLRLEPSAYNEVLHTIGRFVSLIINSEKGRVGCVFYSL